MGLSQLHILSLSLVLPLSPSQIASSSPHSFNFTSSHRCPHLLTAKGFLRDQLVLILFKVRIKQNPNFSITVLCLFFLFWFLRKFWNFALKFRFTVTLAHFYAGGVPILFFHISGTESACWNASKGFSFSKTCSCGFVFCSSGGLGLLVSVVLKFYLFILFYWFAEEKGNTYVLWPNG